MKLMMVVICLAIIGMGLSLGFFAEASYSGKETFHTEQEYTLFKEAISNPNVRIYSIQSLSSEPPIIVNFDITTPRDKVFPYGKKADAPRLIGYGLIGFGFVVLCFVLLYNPKQVEN